MGKYLTTQEVADVLRVAPQTLRMWRHAGDRGPKSFKIGAGRVLYAAEDVEAFIAEARTQASA